MDKARGETTKRGKPPMQNILGLVPLRDVDKFKDAVLNRLRGLGKLRVSTDEIQMAIRAVASEWPRTN